MPSKSSLIMYVGVGVGVGVKVAVGVGVGLGAVVDVAAAVGVGVEVDVAVAVAVGVNVAVAVRSRDRLATKLVCIRYLHVVEYTYTASSGIPEAQVRSVVCAVSSCATRPFIATVRPWVSNYIETYFTDSV